MIGDSGLGKSTLIKSLFQNDALYENRYEDGTSGKFKTNIINDEI